MKKNLPIQHEFIEFVPADREDGKLYVSIAYATAVHNCFCGCGTKVVTPISPTGWQLSFDGDTVSLFPSVGNWNLPCQSHYFIKRDTVVWAGRMTKQEIERGREADQAAREVYYGSSAVPANTPVSANGKSSGWSLWKWLTGRR